MAEELRIAIQTDLRPAYYDDFHCLASDCRLNCCNCDWRITFDKKDYLKIKSQRYSPELAPRVEHAMRRIRNEEINAMHPYAEFRMHDGICPLLEENGYCALQAEKGLDLLPEVCKVFPRTTRCTTSGYSEKSLSTACEGVLALLWDLPGGVDFRSDILPKDEQVIFSFKDPFLRASFQDIRSLCIDFLQERRFSLPERIMLMGLALRRLAEGEAMEKWLPWAQALLGEVAPGSLLQPVDEKTMRIFLHDMLKILTEGTGKNDALITYRKADSDEEQLIDIWGKKNSLAEVRRAAVETLGASALLDPDNVSLERYLDARASYEERFGDREYFMENLMVSQFFFCAYPGTASADDMWRTYVGFCNFYAFQRFASILSCRKNGPGDREELFRLLVQCSRALLHNRDRHNRLRDELFQNDSATLAHMAILLCG